MRYELKIAYRREIVTSLSLAIDNNFTKPKNEKTDYPGYWIILLAEFFEAEEAQQIRRNLQVSDIMAQVYKETFLHKYMEEENK